MSNVLFPEATPPATDVCFVEVALDLPVDRLFTYSVPADMVARTKIGFRVRVPFRGRTKVGIVTHQHEKKPSFKTLPVSEAPDETPVLSGDLLELAAFVGRYYGTSLGEAASAMLPRGVRHRGKGRTHTWVAPVPDLLDRLAAEEADTEKPVKRSEAATRILRVLRRHPPGYSLTDLCRRAHTSVSPVRTLEKHGLVALTTVSSTGDDLLDALSEPIEVATPPEPTPEQHEAIDAINEAVLAKRFEALVLLGVTGSGKTEVYLRAIETCRAEGRQAIVLVPEIALTPQTVRRFRARFERVAVLHSGMTERERALAWRTIRDGEADVVIGPRSAVFAPLPALGLIVVDEEHETTFKQQNNPRYHARDVGLVRARNTNAVVVMGTATPSLESYASALKGRYRLLHLRSRVPGRRLPEVQRVDLRLPEERARGRTHFSRTLEVRMTEALRDKGQIILLQNRRGFATSVACPRCGFILNCEHCDIALTYHRSDRIGMCHMCGHEKRIPPACPDCALPTLEFRGVGTQTIEDELGQRFPEARVARMDSDTMVSRDKYTEVLDQFAAGEIDILVGTQMIAKGLDFPNVTLVGIVSADTALQLPDFRAAERTFALVAQVAGRAGRGERGGRVVVQTRMPNHPALIHAATQDFEAFAGEELSEREALGYPPYARMLRIVVRGTNERALDARAVELHSCVAKAGTTRTRLLGPATPSVARVQGQLRRHILVRAPSPREIAEILRALRSLPSPKRGITEHFDVDPVGVG